jgi:hypothetical protein
MDDKVSPQPLLPMITWQGAVSNSYPCAPLAKSCLEIAAQKWPVESKILEDFWPNALACRSHDEVMALCDTLSEDLAKQFYDQAQAAKAQQQKQKPQPKPQQQPPTQQGSSGQPPPDADPDDQPGEGSGPGAGAEPGDNESESDPGSDASQPSSPSASPDDAADKANGQASADKNKADKADADNDKAKNDPNAKEDDAEAGDGPNGDASSEQTPADDAAGGDTQADDENGGQGDDQDDVATAKAKSGDKNADADKNPGDQGDAADQPDPAGDPSPADANAANDQSSDAGDDKAADANAPGAKTASGAAKPGQPGPAPSPSTGSSNPNANSGDGPVKIANPDDFDIDPLDISDIIVAIIKLTAKSASQGDNPTITVKKIEGADYAAYSELIAACGGAAARVADSLRRLLMGRAVKVDRRFIEEGELDMNNIVGMAVGDANVFHRRMRSRALAADVSLLLDKSGSMEAPVPDAGCTRFEMLCRAAALILNAIAKFRDISTEILTYTDLQDGVAIGVVKSFEESNEHAKAALGALSKSEDDFGGTPSDIGLLEALRRILKRRAAKKIIFFITDGEAGDPAAMMEAARAVLASGVILIGIGIGPHAPQMPIPGWIRIVDIGELPTQLLSIVSTNLIAGGLIQT